MQKRIREKILIVDDDASICNIFRNALSIRGYEILSASNGYEAMDILRQNQIAMIFADIKMPKMSGISLLKRVKEFSPNVPVVMITGYVSIESAVELIKHGATDYIPKPISLEKINQVIDKSLCSNNIDRFSRRIITADPKMLKILETIDILSKTNRHTSIFIQGESGTGKELIARAIHESNNPYNGPFVAVNCAALPETLLESELFGYEQGAFTGAIARRIGKFELAHHGTLLLDEIAEMPLSLQVKLLRALQEGEIDRIGSNESIKVDVRIIATTNRDLKEEVKKGTFRADLFYRLYVIPIIVPPLRERKGDIPILVDYFLDKFCKPQGKERPKIPREVMDAFESYLWPGNIRELENAVERAVTLCQNNSLSLEDFFPDDHSNNTMNLAVCEGITLREMEKLIIIHTLKKVNGNKEKAAKILGITTRTIRNKLKEYNRKI